MRFSMGRFGSLSLLLTGLQFLWPTASQGQVVIGKILDGITGDPVREAEVILLNHDRGVVARGLSNARGRYTVQLKEAGILMLTVERIGYESEDTLTIIVPPENSAYLELKLRPKGVELPGITVSAHRLSRGLSRSGFYDRKKRGLGDFLESQEIQRYPGVRLVDALRRIPGIMVRNDVPYVFRSQSLRMRQGGLCPPAILLDGMLLFGDGRLDGIPAEWVSAVEVYKGGHTIPAQWRHHAGCGLIAIWTWM